MVNECVAVNGASTHGPCHIETEYYLVLSCAFIDNNRRFRYFTLRVFDCYLIVIDKYVLCIVSVIIEMCFAFVYMSVS